MRFWNEAYVLPGITDEDVQRNGIIEKSMNGDPAMLHHHSRSEGCASARKKCEIYKSGELTDMNLPPE